MCTCCNQDLRISKVSIIYVAVVGVAASLHSPVHDIQLEKLAVNIRGYINRRIFGDHPANCSS
jgi:hypothetical protein